MEKEKFASCVEEHKLYILIQKFKVGEVDKAEVQTEFGNLLKHILGIQAWFWNKCPHICSKPHTIDDYTSSWREGARILKLGNELVKLYMDEFRVGRNAVAEQCERYFWSRFKLEEPKKESVDKPKKTRKKKEE